MVKFKIHSIIQVFVAFGIAILVSACGEKSASNEEDSKAPGVEVASAKSETPVAHAFEYKYTDDTELTPEQREKVTEELLSLHTELRNRPGFPKFSGIFFMRPHVITDEKFLESAKTAKSFELLEMLFAFRVLRDTAPNELSADLKFIELCAPEFEVRMERGEFFLEIGVFERDVANWRVELKSLEIEVRHFLKFGITQSANLRREALKDIVQKVEAKLPANVALEIPYEQSRRRNLDLALTRETLEKLAQFDFVNLNSAIRSIDVHEDYIELGVGERTIEVLGDDNIEGSTLSNGEIDFFLTHLLSSAEYSVREKVKDLEKLFRTRKSFSQTQISFVSGYEFRTKHMVYEALLKFDEGYFKKELYSVRVESYISKNRYLFGVLEFKFGTTLDEMVEFIKNIKQD